VDICGRWTSSNFHGSVTLSGEWKKTDQATEK